ncbi:hypothetical protein LCGC14_0232070 [marine sediment metagenome]|uniref:Uncharacterized protein n=1 Tax=marine sediment metagenome TaxID=412755 RepID=A0A0F9UEJ8_9ZZZZ
MVTAIIPARGGSQGITRKNVQPLGDKPLFAWSIEVAHEAGMRVVVNTDDAEIGRMCEDFCVEVVMASSSVHSGHAINPTLHTISQLDLLQEEKIFLLLPTGPLRKVDDLIMALKIMKAMKAPSVIGVSRTKPKHSLRWIRDGKLVRLETGNPNKQRQEVEQLYTVNGNLFLSSVEVLEREKTFHVDGAVPIVMSGPCVDIDDSGDLDLARILKERE